MTSSFAAMPAVEVRVRAMADASDSLSGATLMGRPFGNSRPFCDMSLDRRAQQARRELLPSKGKPGPPTRWGKLGERYRQRAPGSVDANANGVFRNLRAQIRPTVCDLDGLVTCVDDQASWL